MPDKRESEKCPTCGGTGRVKPPCKICGGGGLVSRSIGKGIGWKSEDCPNGCPKPTITLMGDANA